MLTSPALVGRDFRAFFGGSRGHRPAKTPASTPRVGTLCYAGMNQPAPQANFSSNSPGPGEVRRALSLYDATSIIVGIIIGAGIYRTTPLIAANTESLATLLAVWLAGGVLAVVGALCYAELATAYPEDGGDYVYLKRSFGLRLAFVFAWTELWIIRPGFDWRHGLHFRALCERNRSLGTTEQAFAPYAAGAILVMTAINVVGVKEGSGPKIC